MARHITKVRSCTGFVLLSCVPCLVLKLVSDFNFCDCFPFKKSFPPVFYGYSFVDTWI